MLLPRLIPSLLINSNKELVKTIRFQNPNYIGDPLNAAYIFSGFEADELLVLDIDASKYNKCISLDFIKSLSTFTKVPLTVGGGIQSLDEIYNILSLGVERIALSKCLANNFNLLSQAAEMYGSSSITVVINTFKNKNGDILGSFGRPELSNNYYPIMEVAFLGQENGAGEIIINHIENEGTRKGFDVNLMNNLNEKLSIPLVALGGCGGIDHMHHLMKKTAISGISCGSFFVYAPDSSQVLLHYASTANWLKDNVENYSHRYKK